MKANGWGQNDQDKPSDKYLTHVKTTDSDNSDTQRYHTFGHFSAPPPPAVEGGLFDFDHLTYLNYVQAHTQS